MPQSAMSTITEEVQTLFDSVIENIGCQIGTMMDSAANMAEAKLLIHQHLYSATSRLFRGFQTPAQQLTYFRDNFNLVVSSLNYKTECYGSGSVCLHS